jgi:hypothetical protein
VPRISDEAIERNRVSSRARYHRNRDHARKVKKEYEQREFETRPFIGWDGEGYNAWELAKNPRCLLDGEWRHHYMLFGASTGEYITGKSLSTSDCIELILQVERENKDAYHIGFAFEYDINMILVDLPWRMLAILKECGKCRWSDPKTNKRYRIEHVPHKWLRVSTGGVSATIYDAFGFFHSSYLAALKKYAIGDPVKLDHIRSGKAGRSHFTYADIEDVTSYWRDEISLLPPLMEAIRTAAYNGGYRISEWHGPGALAAYLLRTQGVSEWHSKTTPTEVKSAIRYAYAGGRFTSSQCGLYLGPIYTADINSAYIWACSLLPRMDRGTWKRKATNDVDPANLARFGIYRIEFDLGRQPKVDAERAGIPEPPYPLFHRAKNGVLRWPRRTTGWYWTPEASLVLGRANARILEAWIFDDDASKPFRFVHDAYDRRVELQRQDDPAEKAYKWALAAMYGAFARRVGWNRQTRKAPPSHELAWAGYITSWCRASVWGAAFKAHHKGNGRGLISIDTDGITATVPFDKNDLPNGVGEGLGQWKLEIWTGILQWQNGIYWLRDSEGNWRDPKSRGIPKGTIPFDAALSALETMDYSCRPFVHPSLRLMRTRFIGYRQALNGQLDKWRRWLTEPVKVTMGGSAAGKAVHMFRVCEACRMANNGGSPDTTDIRSLHTISNMPPLGQGDSWWMSQPHKLPWLEEQPDLPTGFVADEFIHIVRDEDME